MSRFLGFFLVCLLWSALAHAQAKPQVSSVKGYVFDNQKGEFSKENVFAEGFGGLWNQVQVDAVLVIVEVSGEPNGAYWRKQDRKFKVQLNGRGGKAWTQARPVVTLGENGKRYVSFLVFHDTCTTLTVSAKVVGPGPNAPVEVSLPFNCGE